MSSEKKQKTVGYYDRASLDWATNHGGRAEDSFWIPELKKFHELLPNGKLLEIGSGAGKEATTLIKMGYEYIGVDASKGLIKEAQKRNPTAKLIHMDVENLNFPKDTFDGFWAAAVLLHIPKANIGQALTSLRNVTKIGGIGVITLKEGEGESEEQETGRWFAYYRGNEFDQLLEEKQFKVIDREIKAENRPGKPNWLVYYVKAI